MIEALYDIKTRSIGELDIGSKDLDRSPSNAFLRYQLLQFEPFFDLERGAWIESIWYPNNPRTYNLPTAALLYGIIADSLFRPEIVGDKYKRLVQSEFYSEEKSRFYTSYIDEPGFFSDHETSFVQHLGLIALALVDRNQAQVRWKELRNSNLFDKESGVWFEQSSSGLKPGGIKTTMSGLLAEAIFDKDMAEKKFEKLIASDEERNRKKKIIQTNSVEVGEKVYIRTEEELLDTFLTSIFDWERARSYFENLSSSLLFDPKQQLWFRWVQENGRGDLWAVNVCDSDTQLLSVIVERIFERRS